ncbi:MAG: replicative DNA helicase [Clostridia bacterium]
MATNKARVMPNSFEAEQSLLGAILIDNDVSIDIIGKITPDYFYYDSHKIIFASMLNLYNKNLPIDVVTLSDYLEKDDNTNKIGGISYINDLTNILPSAANFKYYLDIVVRNYTMRRLIGGANDIINKAYDNEDMQETLAFAEKSIFDIGKERQKSNLIHIRDAGNDFIKKLEVNMRNKGEINSLRTGFNNIDNVTNGFLPAQLIIIAARPGCGKTAYSLNIAANIAENFPHKNVVVFNLEMSTSEIMQRMICTMAQVSMQKIKKGLVSSEEFEAIWHAKDIYDNSNIFIDDTASTTPQEILSKCRRLAQKVGGLDLVIIDYLQLMGSSISRDSKQQEVSEISRSMKIMAKELSVPVILLSQMSRSIEQRPDKTPKLSDLRESGAIEQDADIVMFLNGEPTNAEVKPIDLIIAKHRNGPCATVNYNFIGDYLKFRETDKQSQNIEYSTGKASPLPNEKNVATEKTQIDFTGNAVSVDDDLSKIMDANFDTSKMKEPANIEDGAVNEGVYETEEKGN